MLVFTVISLVCNLRRQRNYLKSHVKPVLDQAQRENDGSLTDDDCRKINQYYGLAVPAILGEACCVLHGRDMSVMERACSTAQGAMTGLFDDFFDKQYLDQTSIQNLMHAQHDVSGLATNEQLFRSFFSSALTTSPNKELFISCLTDVYHAQVSSAKQGKGLTDTEEIKAITYQKGGTSLLFYRSAFSPEASTAESDLLYHLGAMMQLSNDIFDVYKDRESSINTLITICDDIHPIRLMFLSELQAIYRNAYKTPFSKKQVHRFLYIISVGIFGRVMVCLDQLEANQQLTEGTFKLHTYTRKQLICDMDTWKNKLRSLQYSRKLMRMSDEGFKGLRVRVNTQHSTFII